VSVQDVAHPTAEHSLNVTPARIFLWRWRAARHQPAPPPDHPWHGTL